MEASHYNALSPTERREWTELLARRYAIPSAEVSKQTFERANGWKFPSLPWASLDAGLRPAEVERAKVQWVDFGEECPPYSDRRWSETFDYWPASIRREIAEALGKWIDERDLIAKYAGSDHL